LRRKLKVGKLICDRNMIVVSEEEIGMYDHYGDIIYKVRAGSGRIIYCETFIALFDKI